MAESGREFERLQELVVRLRAEDGCPWDREQTPATIKRFLLEEVYELVDAVDHHTPDHIAGELGDLMFMAIFLAHLFEEKDQFQLHQVLRGVGDKMVRRHPHVFGDSKVESARQVKLNWEEIKRQERSSESFSTALMEIPRALPALLRSYRILSRLTRRLRRPLQRNILRFQLQHSFSDLLEHSGTKDDPPATHTVGRLLLLLVAFSLSTETGAEEALTKSLDRFCSKLEGLEASLTKDGKDWEDVTEEQERSLWDGL